MDEDQQHPENEGFDSGWYLEGVLRDGKRWIIPLDPLPFVVGRLPDCQLSLSSKGISRTHATIYQDGSHLWVKDHESRNGTFLNRKRLVRPTPVQKGDILHFGTLEFRIGLKESAASIEETTTSFHRVGELSNFFHSCEEDLKVLLERQAVVPLFQPIVHLPDRTRFGYEVTGRGTQPGLPSRPEELFSLAADLGREAELSRLFWREGILVGRELPGSPQLFINIHPAEVVQPGLIRALSEARKNAPEASITAEVSEKAVTDLRGMARLRDELLDLGIKLAYDDFGAGQTRLLELVDVPPHFLKFDNALIRNIHMRPMRLFQVVKALVRMAEDLGITCVAEGVECVAEGEACTHAGFQYAQGYYFGRPTQVGVAPSQPRSADGA